ncbi:MAG: sulfite exporter TauE/SafE family protein [Pseudomonadota bacterium]
MLDTPAGLSLTTFWLLLGAAVMTGALHGATGMAGGIVMAVILSHFVGVKVAIPVITCALIFSHSSRVYLYRRDTQWATVGRVLLFGCPSVVLGAVIFSLIDARTVAVVFAVFLGLSIPVKRWARRQKLQTGPAMLRGASVIWGVLAGNVIGPGFFLAPFLQGLGLNRLAFVGTLASVTLVMNIVKLSVFGVTDLMNGELILLGVCIGLATVPGNWLGQRILRKMDDASHGRIVDTLTVLMMLNMIYLAGTTK